MDRLFPDVDHASNEFQLLNMLECLLPKISTSPTIVARSPEGGGIMLRTGICLLSSSTLGVLYRQGEFTYSMCPSLKWYCLSALLISFFCFIATYLRAEKPSFRKIFSRHMIKSPAWKL